MKQSDANKYLIQKLIELLQAQKPFNNESRIINIGASKEVFIENSLSDAGCHYVADRVDINNCSVNHSSIDNCWKCSVESMQPANSQQYDLAFANWVLEHVPDLGKASKEIYRILKPSGQFITTVPSPSSPEFTMAKFTPLWFHKMIRGKEANAWETCYSYSTIKAFIGIFKQAGFQEMEIKYFPSVELYTHRFPLLNVIGKAYDKVISSLKINSLMGHVCVVFEKKSR